MALILNQDVISVMEIPLSKGEFHSQYVAKKDHEIYEEKSVIKFISDLNGLMQKGESDALSGEELASVEKGTAELDQLIAVPVLDENGAQVKYYVKKKQAK